MTPIIYILAIFYAWVAYHSWLASKQLHKYPPRVHYHFGSTSTTTGTVIINMILYGVPFTDKKMIRDHINQVRLDQ